MSATPGRLDRAADWVCRRVSIWWALAGAAGFAVFLAVVLPRQAASSSAYTVRADAPDSSFIYRAADLYAAAEAWGPAGRSAYVSARVTFDVVWPLVYGLFLVITLAWLLARATAPHSRWRRLALLPLLVVLIDYAENFAAAVVMARYPARTPVLAELAPVFTAAKWLLLSVCFGLLPVAAGWALVAVLRRR